MEARGYHLHNLQKITLISYQHPIINGKLAIRSFLAVMVCTALEY